MAVSKIDYRTSTRNKVKQVIPHFEYGTYLDSKMNGVYIENRNPYERDGWRVIKYSSGSMGLKTGYVASTYAFLYSGTLRKCKEHIAKMVEDLQNSEAETSVLIKEQGV